MILLLIAVPEGEEVVADTKNAHGFPSDMQRIISILAVKL